MNVVPSSASNLGRTVSAVQALATSPVPVSSGVPVHVRRLQLMNGLSGDDFIYGTDGQDIVFAGAGDDYVFGGAGKDLIDGGGGQDAL